MCRCFVPSWRPTRTKRLAINFWLILLQMCLISLHVCIQSYSSALCLNTHLTCALVCTACVILQLQAAVIVALLNIQIPLLLGDLVNVVATLEPGHPMRDYFERLLRPGLRLAVNYLAQVRRRLSECSHCQYPALLYLAPVWWWAVGASGQTSLTVIAGFSSTVYWGVLDFC